MGKADGALTAQLQSKLERQLESWRRDLLSLDRRQRLLYFRHTRSASLEIASPGPEAALEITATGRALFLSESDGATGTLEWVPNDRRLVVGNKTSTELANSLRRLDQQSQQTYADRGFWTLYLGLGVLEWIDAEDDKPVVSPILLVPVKLHRDAAQRPYTLGLNEDETILNPALRLKLEQDFDLSLPECDPFDVDIRKVLERVEDAIAGRRGWAVRA